MKVTGTYSLPSSITNPFDANDINADGVVNVADGVALFDEKDGTGFR